MFISLIKTVLPSLVSSKDAKPNFEYFEQSKSQEQSAQEKALEQFNQSCLQADRSLPTTENPQVQFLNYLFGKASPEHQNEALSQFVTNKIETLLTQSTSLVIKSLPVMPNTIVMLVKELGSEDFDTDILIDAISREPSMAADVIKLANTAKFRRNDKVITDLKSAFMVMGSRGLLEGVIYSYLSNFTPDANVYFKQFGDKIWHHSQQCAQLSLLLSIEKEELDISSTAYFVGLIRNIGQMVIFQLMVDAFSYVEPDSSPSSEGFKRLMQTYSHKLTLAIAKEWQLPDAIIRAIKLQHDVVNSQQLLQYAKNDPLALISYEANASSELMCLHESKVIDKKTFDQRIDNLVASEELHRIIDNSGLFLHK